MATNTTAIAQIPCLLTDDGDLFNEGLADKLAAERKKWKPDEK
jgi:hypothetical protein